MIGSDIRKADWLTAIPGNRTAVIVMEGISMYLKREQLVALLRGIAERFDRVWLLMDCYTVLPRRHPNTKTR